MRQSKPGADISITLHERSERTDTLDLKEVMSPPLLARPWRPFESESRKPSYEPPDLHWAQSRHLEEQIAALALEHGASFSEDIHERLDSKRELVTGPEAHRKAYLFEDLTLHDVLVRNIQYVLGIGGGTLLLKSAKDLLLQWLKNKSTREIRIKKGEISICIRGESDLQKALQAVERLNKEASEPNAPSKKKAGATLPARNRTAKKPSGKSASTKKESTRKA